MGFWKDKVWNFGRTDKVETQVSKPSIDNAPQELKDAEKRCPDVKFVQSCRAFYEKRGFLSENQRNALRYSGTPFRRERQFWGNQPLDQDEDNPFDPDRD